MCGFFYNKRSKKKKPHLTKTVLIKTVLYSEQLIVLAQTYLLHFDFVEDNREIACAVANVE